MTNFNIIAFDQVTSTNDMAFQLAREGKANNYSIIIANSQTGGRGRLDRAWVSPIGNLYMSLLLQFNKIDRITDYSFLSALAIGEVLNFHNIQTQYKWPNDIILSNKKLAGILLQLEKINDVYNLVIGIGVNLVSAPEYATHLAEYKISREEFLKKFCDNFLNLQNKYQQFGFAIIKENWLKNAYKIKQQITLSNGASGIFEGIDDEGNLLLLDNKGKLHKILAEEIL